MDVDLWVLISGTKNFATWRDSGESELQNRVSRTEVKNFPYSLTKITERQTSIKNETSLLGVQ